MLLIINSNIAFNPSMLHLHFHLSFSFELLKKNEAISPLLTANLDTIGVRIPANSIALKILESVNYPLATTSANISGEESGIKLADFEVDFADKVDAIIDGGESKLKVASTIVQVDDKDNIKILRQGTLKIK